ncbi:MAG: BMP family ABC transporter substrate-binding protein [Lachnospiraceae bacterium]|nr:BMP family ABC transporter substrate-binding protein [Lachnospiraceae bacterium]
MILFGNKTVKSLSLFLAALLFAFSLCGCSSDPGSDDGKEVDVVLVTDFGTIDDNSFNQLAWEGIKQYAEESGIRYEYYHPEDTDYDSIMQQFKRGYKNDAQLFVCPGTMLEVPVYNAQDKYGKSGFIIVDGIPHNEDGTKTEIGENTEVITFAEEQAGFLAGYAAVRDGYKGLGFMGGIPVDPVIRYGYGFVQGADYAAIEMGVNVHIRYTYTNTFSDEPGIEDMAGAWFDDDTEVIFACGGNIGKPVIRAAENHNGKVIGVDVDQSGESETVITSAMKDIKSAVYNDVKAYFEGSFTGGNQKNVTAADNGVCLPMETSRFEKFDKDSYDTIYSHLVDGMIAPYNKTDIGTCDELSLINTEVTYIDYDAVGQN